MTITIGKGQDISFFVLSVQTIKNGIDFVNIILNSLCNSLKLLSLQRMRVSRLRFNNEFMTKNCYQKDLFSSINKI